MPKNKQFQIRTLPKREVSEEIGWKAVDDQQGLGMVRDAKYTTPIACLYDPSTSVGAVHLGFVHVLRVQSEEVAAHCASVVNPQFIPLSAINLEEPGHPEYEPWSQICLQNIHQILEKAK